MGLGGYNGVMDTAWNIAADFWRFLGEMSPYLLLGFAVAGGLSVVLSAAWVSRHLGGGGPGPVLKASAMGVPLPLCSCGVIPVAASLRRKGASRAATTAFLISTPQTGVDSILVTFSLLGWVFAIFRPILALVSGLVGGAVVGVVGGSSPIEEKTDVGKGSAAEAGPSPPRGCARAVEALRHGFVDLPRDLGKALLLGLAASALITALVPDDLLSGALGTGFSGMLVMMAVAIPLYVCATASVPVAAALMLKGASPGAALVFLMTGPATNAATIATIWKLLGRRTAVGYLATMVVCALAGGLLLDQFLPSGIVSAPLAGHGASAGWVAWGKHIAAVVLLGVLAAAILPGLWKRGARPVAGSAEIRIGGMTCGHCARAVRRALLAAEGVATATVDLSRGIAAVTGGRLDPAALRRAIEAAGYTVDEGEGL